jgi:hypothetical protein
VKKMLVLGLALAAGLLAGGAERAGGATNECRGLMICVPVAGPWVLVPTASAVPRQRVEYQMTCPRGYIVGGLDAQLSDRMIDVGFVALLGSPVNPGITTARSVVLLGMYVGGGARAASFRPHIGCMPASGGGGVRIRTSVTAVFHPGEPTVRRLRTVELAPGRRQVTLACRRGERLVSAAHAVGFYTAAPPTPAQAAAVRTSRTIRNGNVVVSVRAGAALEGERVVVQVSALCARRG